ncbi:DNA helicase II [Arsenophonus endosymbiont of Lipoptena cervi]|uniref:DNA helicase II n=1 Tax=Arsenophonus endosymbiont of Lipoptena cervi TaxID=363258 RepID=UPI00376F3481
MKFFNLLNNLNDKQKEAVSADRINMLILAGAGSGKTRVLIYRIAWLLLVDKVHPLSIMAVTFTNKAADEIRCRVKTLLGSNINPAGIWVGTFHGLAYRLLRLHYLDAKLPRNFQILDNNDQYQLLLRIIKTINLDKSKWLPRQAMLYINKKKDEGLRPEYIESYSNPIEEMWLRVYKIYQEECDKLGLVDFSEILLRSQELWLNNPDILKHYSNRFTNILVDEFQDTNSIQYAWIRLLASNTSKLMIIGDDDQSIYSWRGAQIENIQRFLHDFPETKIIRMEQNYRSTKNILKSANTLITNNNNRLGKFLWTEGPDGDPISIYCGINELDEARYVINKIKQWNEAGGNLNECAILYRNNAQSRIFEETLLYFSIPYCIYGNQKFFERQEVKNVLAYLRLVANRNDDISFERVVNVPPHGIGKKTLEIIRTVAQKNQLTLWKSCEYLLTDNILARNKNIAISRFLSLINSLDQETYGMTLHVQIEQIILKSGLRNMYEKKKENKGQERINNLNELLTTTKQFNYQEDSQDITPINAFLSYVTLRSDDSLVKENQDTVQLMTIHAAKGLEFPLVFIVGMEEGIFPNQMNIEDVRWLAEERRLAYVGLTRAMKKLILTYSKSRQLYGKEVYHSPSRFIDELPIECIKKVYLNTNISNSISYKRTNTKMNKNYNNYLLGQVVYHSKFGNGTIINFEGNGDRFRIQVIFNSVGIKWLVVNYAKLKCQ